MREIADIRDETDLSGLRIAIDLKRSVDPELLMAKLFRSTTLQDSFSCNFNVLVDGYPRPLWACARSCRSGLRGAWIPRDVV